MSVPSFITIDGDRCVSCGACVTVCQSGALFWEDGHIHSDPTRHLGCMSCGQCMTVCPQEAITVDGDRLLPEDIFELPPREARANYEQLKALMLARRSARNFQDKPVERESIKKILEAASTAPMGIPPTSVSVLVLNGKDKVREMANDLLDALQRSRWIFSPLMLAVSGLFMDKESAKLLKTFVAPVSQLYLEKRREGEDRLFYNAPLAMYFYGKSSMDVADPVIASTCAMLAAESLGLGSCFIGFPPYIFQRHAKLKKKYGLPLQHQPGIMLIFGHPAIHHRRAVRRKFSSVRYVDFSA